MANTMFDGFFTSLSQLSSSACTVDSWFGNGSSNTVASMLGGVTVVRRCVSSAMRCCVSSLSR